MWWKRADVSIRPEPIVMIITTGSQTGIDRSTNDTPQWIPCPIVEPVVEFVETLEVYNVHMLPLGVYVPLRSDI